MALKGSFKNYITGEFGLYCDWTGKQNIEGGYTDVTLNVYLSYFTIQSPSRPGSVISINGKSETYTAPGVDDLYSESWKKVKLKSKTVRVKTATGGSGTQVKLSATYPYDGYYNGIYIADIVASTTVTIDPLPVSPISELLIIEKTGGHASVERVSSTYAGIGEIKSGASLFKDDRLKITFSADEGLVVGTRTVNGKTYASGGVYTVKTSIPKILRVEVEGQKKSSKISATDANVGGVSTVMITRYASSYWHSIKVSFGDIHQYLKSDGSLTSIEAKHAATNIPFKIPTEFYNQMKSVRQKECTLTCTTYNGNTQIGVPFVCKFKITASSKPSITISAKDVNQKTVALTGDDSSFVRYLSTMNINVRASSTNGAFIDECKINDVPYLFTQPVNISMQIKNVSDAGVTVWVKDSRGYEATSVYHAGNMVPYIKPTINPVVTRPTSTSKKINLTFSGDYYSGKFNNTSADNNNILIRYRYRLLGETPESTFGKDFIEIDPICIQFGKNKYKSVSPIELIDDFDYLREYEFEFVIVDGVHLKNPFEPLTRVSKKVSLSQGLPIFDWGKNDFNFNVPVTIQGKSVFATPTPVSDYVVSYTKETASDKTVWMCRRWSSGLVECWTDIFVEKGTIENPYGAMFYGAGMPASKYPVKFKERPKEFIDVKCFNYGVWYYQGNLNTVDQTGTYNAVCPLKKTTPSNFHYEVYAVGEVQM